MAKRLDTFTANAGQAEFERKRNLTREALQKNIAGISDIYRSSDMQKMFRQLNAATFPRDGAILHKQRILFELRERKLIDENLLRQAPAVYAGSGIDFEYPVLMGARRVIMVDPIFSDERARADLINRISQIAEVTEASEELCFEVSFDSEEKEIVTLLIRPEIFGNPTLPHVEAERNRFQSFSFEGSISLLLGFRTEGADIDTDPTILGHMLPGGVVLADHMSSRYLQSLSEDDKGHLFRNVFPDIVAIHESLKGYWIKQGFDFIPLVSEGEGYNYTLLKKK